MMQETIPFINSASIIVVIAGLVSIKLAHAHTQQAAFVRNDDFAPVFLGALVVVVAFSTKGWNSYADTKVAELRLHCLAEPWALVALPEIIVTFQAADGEVIHWRRDASALITVATASAPKHQNHVMPT
jgi:hypothetical protein